MRRIVYSTLLFLVFSFPALSQTGGVNFQDMARNAAGEPLANQKISLRLSVLLITESGTVEYSETKEAATSGQGIFSVVIGDGSVLTKTGNFTDINWKNSPKFLKVEMDPNGGTNFALLGTSRLQAVPFAYYANGVDAENIQGTLPIGKGGTGVGSIAALKTSLGIDQVNNTSDANKPLSTDAQAALGTKVDKVTGKELSSNDYSAAEKTKLAAITGTNTGDQDLSGFATTTALALKANTSDVTTSLGLKANAADLTTGLATKVDKVTGKELSSNDYSAAEKTKLAAITGTNTGDQDLTGFATTTALALKANTSDVTTSLGLKANTSEVTTGLALKENNANKSSNTSLGLSDDFYPTQKAVKNYVDAQINTGGISDGSILTRHIAAANITTALVANAAITDIKIASGINKSKVGLDNVENTTDLAKPISAATQTALDLKATISSVNGSLDTKVDKVTGKELSTNDYTSAEKTKLAGITGTNTGDNAVNSNYSALQSNATHTGEVTGSTSLTIVNAAVTTPKIADAAITNAKVNDVAATKITGILSTTNGGTGVATTLANALFAGPDGVSGAPSFRTLVAADLPINSTGYIQNAPDATQTGSIDISGTAKIGTALNVNGIYIGVGKNNQSTSNTAVGNNALQGVADGTSNASFGISSMQNNNGGIENTALGSSAMLNSTTGRFNTATGFEALSSNTGAGNSGDYNVANGYKALLLNQTGSKNVGVGYNALVANRTGSNNTAIGNQADVAAGNLTNATALGNGAVVNASNTIQLGNSSVSSVITSGAITAPSFIGTLNGNATSATTATTAGNITATTNTTLTTLSSLTSVGTIASLTTGVITNTGKAIVGASSAASASAVLEVTSTTQGFLPPRLNYYQRTQITSPVAGLTVWCTNCGGSGEMQVFNGGAWTNMTGGTATGTISLSIGDSYQGGKVAYLLVDGDSGYDANTQHGLIAATSDQGTVIYWNTGFNNITGATGTAIGTGLSNTDKFIVSHGAYTNFAPGLARAYGGGYTDWYLPSKDELGKLILNENAIGVFEWGSRYWSSSEFNKDNAYYYYVGFGFYTGLKNLAQSRVRAVRSF